MFETPTKKGQRNFSKLVFLQRKSDKTFSVIEFIVHGDKQLLDYKTETIL